MIGQSVTTMVEIELRLAATLSVGTAENEDMQARRQGGARAPPFFSLIIACHFTEVLNCMSNRLRLHAILSISLTKPHLVQLINIRLDTYEL